MGDNLDGGVPRGEQQLLDEEGVAGGPPMDGRRHLESDRLTPYGGEQLSDLVDGQAGQADMFDPALSLEGGQHVGHMAPVECLGPIGADHEHVKIGGGQPDEGGQTVGVGPVEILEDHDPAPVGQEVAQ